MEKLEKMADSRIINNNERKLAVSKKVVGLGKWKQILRRGENRKRGKME